MYKVYFKQAIAMLKQNKFISLIAIIGTALAIMMIMVIVTTESVKNMSIAPEINRNRTMYLKIHEQRSKNGMFAGRISFAVYKNYLSNFKTPELTTALISSADRLMIKADGKGKRTPAKVRFVDAAYWKIMSFSFLEGKPFTQEEFDSGLQKAVIGENTAKALYGNTNVVGKVLEVDFKPYTIIGVIKNVSSTFEYAGADVYVPYTSKNNFQEARYNVLYLAYDKQDFTAIYEEAREAERKFNAADPDWDMKLFGPYNHSVQQLNKGNYEPNIAAGNRKMIFILAVLLLVPAVNLSGFSLSRIKRRTEEIGIRKAFGAKKRVILSQVLYENLVTSLIGGFVGLLFSYVVVVWLKEWLLGVESGGAVPVEALVSLPVFLAVFVACVMLNLLSAGIPAYRASRMNIVDSLNQKK